MAMITLLSASSALYSYSIPYGSHGFFYEPLALPATPMPSPLHWRHAVLDMGHRATHMAQAFKTFEEQDTLARVVRALQSEARQTLQHNLMFRNMLMQQDLISLNRAIRQPEVAPSMGQDHWKDSGDHVVSAVHFLHAAAADKVTAQLEDEVLTIRCEHPIPHGQITSVHQLSLPFRVADVNKIDLDLAEDGKSISVRVPKSEEVKPAVATLTVRSTLPEPAADAEKDWAANELTTQEKTLAQLDEKFEAVVHKRDDASPASMNDPDVTSLDGVLKQAEDEEAEKLHDDAVNKNTDQAVKTADLASA